MGRRSGIDWIAIQRDWELDRYRSDRALAEAQTRNGNKISHVAIGKAAKGWPDSEGNPTKPVWTKRLADQAKDRAREIMALRDAEGETTEARIESAARAEVDRRVAIQQECEQLLIEQKMLGKMLFNTLQFAAKLPSVSEGLSARVLRERTAYVQQQKLVQQMYREAYELGEPVKPREESDDDIGALTDALWADWERRAGSVDPIAYTGGETAA